MFTFKLIKAFKLWYTHASTVVKWTGITKWKLSVTWDRGRGLQPLLVYLREGANRQDAVTLLVIVCSVQINKGKFFFILVQYTATYIWCIVLAIIMLKWTTLPPFFLTPMWRFMYHTIIGKVWAMDTSYRGIISTGWSTWSSNKYVYQTGIVTTPTHLWF